MPPLQGFSNNPLRSKADFVEATEALLRPLLPCFSPTCSRIKVPVATGAHFDATAAQVEGFSRPLWAVATLLSDPDAPTDNSTPSRARRELLQHWVDGLASGVDPASPGYWGAMHDWDQRMVESEIISYALLAAPDAFYAPLAPQAKKNLSVWLQSLNEKVMPPNNWRWFRVLTNLALINVCGEPADALWPLMDKELVFLEQSYVGDGWASDGAWRPVAASAAEETAGDRDSLSRSMDYYSGSFAIQFSQLLYSKYATNLDPRRCALFQDRARQFIRSFWAYSDIDGAPIAFGRSLTYRFAMGAFYAAFASAGLCDDADELTSHGAVKGMLLRHLRWWANHSEGLFWPDGTLTIGFLYPNMFMCEDYNSPQSPYWALKALIVANLPATHAFWTSDERPHPLAATRAGLTSTAPKDVAAIRPIKPTRHIVCNHPQSGHHFMLSSGQFAVWPMKATQAKYAKFAYSSAFGFSVPTGPLLHQMAPDNALALSPDNGETWTVRWTSIGDTQFVDLPAPGGGVLPALVSHWKPWKSRDVDVETTLIPPSDRWPDWHVRVHRLRSGSRGFASDATFAAAEGGFANSACRKSDGRFLWRNAVKGPAGMSLKEAGIEDEGVLETPSSCFILSQVGATGVVDVSPPKELSHLEQTAGELVRADPNTNLLMQQTSLPAIRHSCAAWPHELLIATAVFAVPFKEKVLSAADVQARWSAVPKVSFGKDGQLSLV